MCRISPQVIIALWYSKHINDENRVSTYHPNQLFHPAAVASTVLGSTTQEFQSESPNAQKLKSSICDSGRLLCGWFYFRSQMSQPTESMNELHTGSIKGLVYASHSESPVPQQRQVITAGKNTLVQCDGRVGLMPCTRNINIWEVVGGRWSPAVTIQWHV